MDPAHPSTSDAETPSLPRPEVPASPRASVSLHRPCPCGPSRQGESCVEPPSSLASFPTSGPCKSTACPLNEWMRTPNDGDDDKEEEVKGAETQVAVPDSGISSVHIHSFNLMTRSWRGAGGQGSRVLPLFSPWSQQVHSRCPGAAAATGHTLDSFNTNSFSPSSGVRNL